MYGGAARMAPSAPWSRAKRTLAMVASVLGPVQPSKKRIRPVFIFAVSTTTCLRSSGESIVGSPVEPMKSTALVPWSSWKRRSVRKASKSTEPSWLKGVINATNDPSILSLDLRSSSTAVPPLRGSSRA